MPHANAYFLKKLYFVDLERNPIKLGFLVIPHKPLLKHLIWRWSWRYFSSLQKDVENVKVFKAVSNNYGSFLEVAISNSYGGYTGCRGAS